MRCDLDVMGAKLFSKAREIHDTREKRKKAQSLSGFMRLKEQTGVNKGVCIGSNSFFAALNDNR